MLLMVVFYSFHILNSNHNLTWQWFILRITDELKMFINLYWKLPLTTYLTKRMLNIVILPSNWIFNFPVISRKIISNYQKGIEHFGEVIFDDCVSWLNPSLKLSTVNNTGNSVGRDRKLWENQKLCVKKSGSKFNEI